MAKGADWQAAIEILRPLEAILWAAEARGNRREALQCAFKGASQAVNALAEEAPGAFGLTTVHDVWVELTALPLVARNDGTLIDTGTYVSLEHRQYEVTDQEAAALAARLADRLGSNNGDVEILDSA
jgi:hypothetical protein